MVHILILVLFPFSLVFLAAPAIAQQNVGTPETPQATEAEAAPQSDLESENARLKDQVAARENDVRALERRATPLFPLTGRVTGYLDFGFFRVGGNGSGIRSDTGNVVFPQYAGVVPDSWVFM